MFVKLKFNFVNVTSVYLKLIWKGHPGLLRSEHRSKELLVSLEHLFPELRFDPPGELSQTRLDEFVFCVGALHALLVGVKTAHHVDKRGEFRVGACGNVLDAIEKLVEAFFGSKGSGHEGVADGEDFSGAQNLTQEPSIVCQAIRVALLHCSVELVEFLRYGFVLSCGALSTNSLSGQTGHSVFYLFVDRVASLPIFQALSKGEERSGVLQGGHEDGIAQREDRVGVLGGGRFEESHEGHHHEQATS